MIVFLPLCHAAILIDETEATHALDNHTSNACFNDADCNGHGRCSSATVCICDQGWTTYSNASRTNNSCLYEQRLKLVSFFISLFVGWFGIDWFYLSRGNAGYIVVGVFKLLLGCGCYNGWPFVVYGAKRYSEVLPAIGGIVGDLFNFGSAVWWLVDWTRILADKFPDGNGIELKPF